MVNDKYTISTNIKDMDIDIIHGFLSKESGWSKGIPKNKVELSIQNSLNFGLFKDQQQIGYARVITDYSTVAYLGDFFILSSYRGLGLSHFIMKHILSHKKLQNLRRWMLLTITADWLYEKHGFRRLKNKDAYMEILNKEVYK